MRVAALILLSCCLSACNQNTVETNTLRNKVTHLETRIDTLEQKIDLLIAKQTPLTTKKKAPVTIKKKPPTSVISAQSQEQTDNQSTSISETQQRSIYATPTRSYNTSHQCMGITQRGARCKRMVRNGNYCWQHGG